MRAELAALKKTLPKQYPFLHGVKDSAKTREYQGRIRGDQTNLGEEAPRRFLQILCKGEPAPFTKGSGRLELAEAIASPENPLTARVMVNRIWQHHFGQGLVRRPQQFRPARGASDASGTARLSGGPVRGERLVYEGNASRDYAFGHLPVEYGHRSRRIWRRIRRTVCYGGPIFGNAWMPKRCAIRCWPFPANSIRQCGGPAGSAAEIRIAGGQCTGYSAGRSPMRSLRCSIFQIRMLQASSGW